MLMFCCTHGVVNVVMVEVIWMEGNTVIAIPAVKHGLPCATGYRPFLMKWALHVVGFSHYVEVECLKIHCSSGFGMVAPSHWLVHWYWLENT